MQQEFLIDIERAVEALKEGKIILYPTDTIWGLGCDATNEGAVERLFELKARPSSKAMLSLVDSLETLNKWVKKVPDKAVEMMATIDEPLTIIYDSPQGIAPALKAEDGSAAFRIPKNEFTQEVCRRLGRPLVSTSPNISGGKSPACFAEIDPAIIGKADYVCKSHRYARCASPSRILKITDSGALTAIR